jgi:hypothetical protein
LLGSFRITRRYNPEDLTLLNLYIYFRNSTHKAGYLDVSKIIADGNVIVVLVLSDAFGKCKKEKLE